MRALSNLEIQNICLELRQLQGAHLQKVLSSETLLGLGLYYQGQLIWICFEMIASAPVALRFDDQPPAVKKKMVPVALFLKAHAVGSALMTAEADSVHGRVLNIVFGTPPSETRLEIRLFPHGQNIIIHSGDKTISWSKPKPLLEAKSPPQQDIMARTLKEITEEWQTQSSSDKPVKKPNTQPVGLSEKKTLSLQKAIFQIQTQLKKLEELPWKELGEWLKTHQSLDVPEHFKKWLDGKKTLPQNIQRSFRMAKENDAKLKSLSLKIQKANIEIEKLRTLTEELPAHEKAEKSEKESLLKMGEAQGRQIPIDEFVFYIGKNAQDNLRILRMAQPWDLWMHLKDYAGAHGILRINRKTTVPDKSLRKAGQFLAQFSKASRELRAGDKFEIIVCECRFVRPLKGDRLGRVTHQNGRTLRVEYEE